MQRKRETHPHRQARGCATKSNHMIARNERVGYAAFAALVMFSVLVLPHLVYGYLAPLKGWI